MPWTRRPPMLAILQSEGRISNAALAERLHLSPSPCLRRRALERDGVISGYRAVLDRAKMGLGLTVFVELKVDGHSDHGAAISDAVAAAPEVISASIVSGAADFLLEVGCPTCRPTSACCSGRCCAQRRRHPLQLRPRTVKPAGPLPLWGSAAAACRSARRRDVRIGRRIGAAGHLAERVAPGLEVDQRTVGVAEAPCSKSAVTARQASRTRRRASRRSGFSERGNGSHSTRRIRPSSAPARTRRRASATIATPSSSTAAARDDVSNRP